MDGRTDATIPFYPSLALKTRRKTTTKNKERERELRRGSEREREMEGWATQALPHAADSDGVAAAAAALLLLEYLLFVETRPNRTPVLNPDRTHTCVTIQDLH
ncbi:hypothetical protein ACLOJK_025448 [Asimina triloba]